MVGDTPIELVAGEEALQLTFRGKKSFVVLIQPNVSTTWRATTSYERSTKDLANAANHAV